MNRILNIYTNELHRCLSDMGVAVFLVLVPLFYPLLYTYIYSQEVVRDIPVAVCDLSNSNKSREFIRKTDATPDIAITATCNDMLSARELMEKNQVKGIIFIPEEFAYNLNTGEQAHVSIYCSMASLFYYKSMLVACTEVSLAMNREIEIKRLGQLTAREASVATLPLRYKAIDIANPTTGFANFIIPAILMLIIQQTLLLGIGMRMGTERDKGIIPTDSTTAVLTGRTAAYITICAPTSAYILCVIPAIFELSQLAHPSTLALFMLPYLLACLFFAITLGCFVRDRETPMLLFVFTSVPFLFLSGISWPGSSIPLFWKAISYTLPSTAGINGFVSINETGASLNDVMFEYKLLWLQTVVYCATAFFGIRHRTRTPGICNKI